MDTVMFVLLAVMNLLLLALVVWNGTRAARIRTTAAYAQAEAGWYRSRAAQLEERVNDWRTLANKYMDLNTDYMERIAQMKREGFEVLPPQVDDESWRLTDEEEAQIEQARRGTVTPEAARAAAYMVRKTREASGLHPLPQGPARELQEQEAERWDHGGTPPGWMPPFLQGR